MKKTKEQMQQDLKETLHDKFLTIKYQLEYLKEINELNNIYKWIYCHSVVDDLLEEWSIETYEEFLSDIEKLKGLTFQYNLNEEHLKYLDNRILLIKKKISDIDKPSNQIIDKAKILSNLLDEDKQDE